MRLEQLRGMLLEREYRPRVIEAAFKKLAGMDRHATLKKVENKSSEKLTLVMTYDPRLPKMSAVVHKHFKALMVDPEMRSVFQDKGVQVAFKCHRNIREFLCRAKLYEQNDRRNPIRGAQLGWRRCSKCTTCSHSENKTAFIVSATKERVPITQRLDCKTEGLLYVAFCSRCWNRPQYIGKTKRTLMERGREHLLNIEKILAGTYSKQPSKLYTHFTTNGHTAKDFVIFGFEEIYGDDFTALSRERYWINRADTVRFGLNTYKT